jgi:menaquinone-9 beta-reductase
VPWDVIVVGAGPGGCAAAYFMAQAGLRVVLIERRMYPVEKLCGEFWSPEGVNILRQMGLQACLEEFPRLDQVEVSAASGQVWGYGLSQPGMGGTRYRLDPILVDRCRQVGVEVRLGTRVRSITGDLQAGFCLDTQNDLGAEQWNCRVAVIAYGKQERLRDHDAGPAKSLKPGFVGLKLHIDGELKGAAIQLHAFPGGYAGLGRVEGGRFNLCLLVEGETFRAHGANRTVLGNEMMNCNQLLHSRLSGFSLDWKKAIAVGNLRFGIRHWSQGQIPYVGDAAAAVTPLCGDGMAMALEGGSLLAPLVRSFCARQLEASEFLRRYHLSCRRTFAARLRWGMLLQTVLLRPALASPCLALLAKMPSLGRYLVERTRGSVATPRV